VATIRSVNGVMLTVCPAAVAMEFKVTWPPPEVPTMFRINGAVIPLTSTTKAPSAVVVALGETLPLMSMALTTPDMGAPVAAVPVSWVFEGVVVVGVVVGVVDATVLLPLPPPQAANKMEAAPNNATHREALLNLSDMDTPC
jgi:hypothetical protein